jgi:hypothetical protein
MNPALATPDFATLVEEPVWRDSDATCALADAERHLGHALNIAGRWHAFDATHMDPESNGFRFLGAFESVASAKSSVERSAKPALMSAGAP